MVDTAEDDVAAAAAEWDSPGCGIACCSDLLSTVGTTWTAPQRGQRISAPALRAPMLNKTAQRRQRKRIAMINNRQKDAYGVLVRVGAARKAGDSDFYYTQWRFHRRLQRAENNGRPG